MPTRTYWSPSTDSSFEAVLRALEESGIAADIEGVLRSRRGQRRLSAAALLAGLVVTATTRATATLAEVHRLLTRGLSRPFQVRLGLRDECTGPGTLSYRQVTYLYERLAVCLSLSTAPHEAERDRRLQLLTRLHGELPVLASTVRPSSRAMVSGSRRRARSRAVDARCTNAIWLRHERDGER